MFAYHVPDPDEAMLISGGKAGTGESPFKVVTGRGAFAIPFFRHVNFLTLAMQEAQVTENCVTQQGIAVTTQAICAFKVGNDPEAIVNAAQRFLSDQDQMSALTGRIFAGHLRSIIGSMTVEQIVRERQTLAEQVLGASAPEMAKLGLIVDSFQISSIDDGQAGYIKAMAAPHNAAIQKQAKVAEAEAERESVEAEQKSAREQAQYARDTAVVQAEYRAEQERAQAKANQAGPLAQAEAKQEVTTKETALAERQADLREKQLIAEVVKPAEAEAQKTKILAEADAEATTVKAEAANSNDRVALDRMLIEQLPQIVKNAADGLQHANVNVLDGSDGLANIVAGLVAQGKTVYDSAREMTASGKANGNGSHVEVAE